MKEWCVFFDLLLLRSTVTPFLAAVDLLPLCSVFFRVAAVAGLQLPRLQNVFYISFKLH